MILLRRMLKKYEEKSPKEVDKKDKGKDDLRVNNGGHNKQLKNKEKYGYDDIIKSMKKAKDNGTYNFNSTYMDDHQSADEWSECGHDYSCYKDNNGNLYIRDEYIEKNKNLMVVHYKDGKKVEVWKNNEVMK